LCEISKILAFEKYKWHKKTFTSNYL